MCSARGFASPVRRRTGHRAAGVPLPRDGRPMPVDVKANDLVHWQVRLAVDAAAFAVQAMRAARAWFVSPGLVTLPDAQLGFRRPSLLRDPDGHAALLDGE